MEVVYDDKVKVALTDQMGNNIDFKTLNLYELDDEIRLQTSIINSDLQRGWIGDLTYQAVNGTELFSGNRIVDIQPVENTFQDVLLSRINLLEVQFGRPCIWEYVFLKK